MNCIPHVPPGFRFHPTDEELVDYYLRKKIASKRIDLDIIKDVDLYKIEPWDLQELCKLGSEDQNEWYFFSHKDKKYPTGTRTNRATKAGFWKATGRDKAIYARHCLVGMRKTLVFYKGRAPNGQKSDWIMHEYRLESNENGTTTQEEGWVVCRVFKKRMPTMRKVGDYGSPCWYDDQVCFMAELDSPSQISHSSHPYTSFHGHPNNYQCKQELELQYNKVKDPIFLHQLPHLESPKIPPRANNPAHTAMTTCNSSLPYGYDRSDGSEVDQIQRSQRQNMNPSVYAFGATVNCEQQQAMMVDQVTDWRVMDKFVASQLSNYEDDQDQHNQTVAKGSNYSQGTMIFEALESERKDIASEFALASSTSSPSCQVDLWK